MNQIKVKYGLTRKDKRQKVVSCTFIASSKSIIDKYEHHPVREKGILIPVPTNQKMNAYLKEIADLCGIKRTLQHIVPDIHLQPL